MSRSIDAIPVHLKTFITALHPEVVERFRSAIGIFFTYKTLVYYSINLDYR
jgi:hypothetical protein